MQDSCNLAEGNIFTRLLKFTVPIIFSILLQTTYGTMDLLIVGRFATVGDVSAVSIGSQIMDTVTALFTGLSLGTTVLIGKYIGSKQYEKTNDVIATSIILLLWLSIVVMCILVFFNKNIAVLMKTPAESFEQTKNYLMICGFGTIFIVFYNLIGSIFRGIGDAKTPLITVLIACIINIVLDLVFIGIFNLGSNGAGMATVIAQSVSVILSLRMIKNKDLPFNNLKGNIKFNKDVCKKILLLGIPVALQSVLVRTSFLAMISIINNFGVVASASVGIVEKITGFIMIVPSAFMQSLSAFVSQNIGADKPQRAVHGLYYGMGISLIFGLVMAYLATFHGTIFTGLFTDDAETTEFALLYLKSYALDCILVAVMFSFSGYFNGCGRTAFVMIQSVLGSFLVRIPLAYYFASLENTSLFVIGLATPMATFFQIIACIIFFWYVRKYKENNIKYE